MNSCINTGCLEFESRCKKCNRLLSEANVGPEWFLISEKEPDQDGYYIVCYLHYHRNNEPIVSFAYFEKLGKRRKKVSWWKPRGAIRKSNIIAWMPLPEPPKTY